MNTLKEQLLVAVKERRAAEQAQLTAATRLMDTRQTVNRLADQLAREALGEKRGLSNAIVVSLGSGLGLWCCWQSSHKDPSTQVVEVKE